MNRKKLLIAAVMVFVISAPAFTMNFIVGAKSGYYVWEPYIKDIGASGFAQIDQGAGMLYGPVISAMFTGDLSLSLAVLTGEQSTQWNVKFEPWEGEYLAGTYYFESWGDSTGNSNTQVFAVSSSCPTSG